MLVCLVLPWKGVVGMETKKSGGEGGEKRWWQRCLKRRGEGLSRSATEKGVLTGCEKGIFFVWYTSVEIKGKCTKCPISKFGKLDCPNSPEIEEEGGVAKNNLRLPLFRHANTWGEGKAKFPLQKSEMKHQRKKNDFIL